MSTEYQALLFGLLLLSGLIILIKVKAAQEVFGIIILIGIAIWIFNGHDKSTEVTKAETKSPVVSDQGNSEREPPVIAINQPFYPDLKLIVDRRNGHLVIEGHTNFPEGTKVTLIMMKPWLSDWKQRQAAGVSFCDSGTCLLGSWNPIVHSGVFQIGPLSNTSGYSKNMADPTSEPIPHGTYTLTILIFSGMGQPREVRRIIGNAGENLRGPNIVMPDPNGGKDPVMAVPPWSPNRSEAEKFEGFSFKKVFLLDL